MFIIKDGDKELAEKKKKRQNSLSVEYAVAYLKRIKANIGEKIGILITDIIQNARVVEVKQMRRKENSYERNFIQMKGK